ncbi:MAG: hypothetical protein J5736_02030, partial [Bacilli bacterium]|nr:hypothetical protein [Bacilli bacterium]
EWSIANQSYDRSQFQFSLAKMSLDGALFDMGKLNYFSAEVIAKTPVEELYEKVRAWAISHDRAFFQRIDSNPEYFQKILNIGRDRPNPRKDYAKYSDIAPLIAFFYYPEWKKMLEAGLPFNEKFDREFIASFLSDLKDKMIYGVDEPTWFGGLKEVGAAHNFATANKDYKANPEKFAGSISDAAELLRIALTGSKNSPNLHEVIEILGHNEVSIRLNEIVALLRK